MKTIKDFKLKGKYVLLRSDLNSDARDGRFVVSERIKEAAGTIKLLQGKGAKVVVLAHQGTPGKSDFISLKKHSLELNKYCKIRFVDDLFGKKASVLIDRMDAGEGILLENVRFERDEFYPKKRFNRFYRKDFLEKFELYVNDSFSVCHRDHTSISGIAKKIESCAGPLIEKELKALERVHMKECLYILGGAKPSTNVKLLGKGKILAGGFFANMAVISRGTKLGKLNEYNKDRGMKRLEYNKVLSKIRRRGKEVVAPVDLAVDFNGKRREFVIEEFPMGYQVKDIGSRSIKNYVSLIKKAKTIYMKGPIGFSTEKGFDKGTVEVLRAVAESKAFSIVGGGHLSDAIKRSGISKKRFGHVSLSGGALLNYIAGERLVGLEVLGYY